MTRYNKIKVCVEFPFVILKTTILLVFDVEHSLFLLKKWIDIKRKNL